MSGGSFLQHSNLGLHAYKIMHNSAHTAPISGAVMSPHSDLMSSLPTEHYGAIAILITLIVLLDHHGLSAMWFPLSPYSLTTKRWLQEGLLLILYL